RGYAERRQVVGDHHAIVQALDDRSIGPDALAVGRAEELIRECAVVHLEPERVRPIRAARRRQRRNAGIEIEPVREVIPELAADHDLRTLAHRRLLGPYPDAIGEIWVQQPTPEAQIDLVPLHVLPQMNIEGAAEAVCVRLVETELIQITRIS